ncbi:MAG: ribonuclease P protein component [Bacteroides sp.]|nr:ribonuclease P protein component [Bacteroides sp.]
MGLTFTKAERLKSKKTIEKMFAGGARSFSIFPVRVVYMPVEKHEADVSILLSVSKKRFKRAVKRNRVKRQLREAYRKNKTLLTHTITAREYSLAVAFIYLDDSLPDSIRVEEVMQKLLKRIAENQV